jgi:hypothetical protein
MTSCFLNESTLKKKIVSLKTDKFSVFTTRYSGNPNSVYVKM